MNNTINNLNNISFNARYVNFVNKENMPGKVYDAILKNDAIDEFIAKGKPKTILGKIIDLFRKDESLDISYSISKSIDLLPDGRSMVEHLTDPYNKKVEVLFKFNKRNGDELIFPLSAEQSGIRRKQGSIPKPGEHHAYKPPLETAEDMLVKKINEMKELIFKTQQK